MDLRGQTSVEYLVLAAISAVVAVVVVAGYMNFFGVLDSLGRYLDRATSNMGVDIFAARS